jgi:hypothetical protein
MFLKENRCFPRAGVTQLVECDLAKVDVAGSNPVSRSIIYPSIAMSKTLLASAALCAAASLFAQDYKLETVAAPAPALPSSYASVIQNQGYRVTGPSGPWCEIWFRSSIPSGPKPGDPSISFPIEQGTLIGVIHFPASAADRRGQTLKPGVYTLRYSDYPVDGAHQGVAPQRDFLLLTPIASDPNPETRPDFASLVKMSLQASGTPHPAVLSIETPMGSTFPEITKEGERDTVLNVKLGDIPFAIIVAGEYQG